MDVDVTGGRLLECLQMRVGEQVVDGHVDDFVGGVLDELDHPAGDGGATPDGPDGEVLGRGVGGLELVEELRQLRERVLPPEVELPDGRLGGDRRELLR